MTDNPLLFAALVGGVVTYRVALLTLDGVVMSLDAAAKRSANELAQAGERASADREHVATQAVLEREHSAEEARRERLTTMRRDVYLEAVEGLSNANGTFAKFSKQDLQKLDASEVMVRLSTLTSRVAVVGEQQTALKARAMVGIYGKILMQGFVYLLPLDMARKKEAADLKAYEITQREIEVIVAAMNNLNQPGNSDPAKFEFFQKEFRKQTNAAVVHATARVESLKEVEKHEGAYLAFLRDEFKILASQIDDLLFAVRAELSIATDPEQFRDQTLKTQGEIEELMVSMQRKMHAFRDS